jgi:hypothetical protein
MSKMAELDYEQRMAADQPRPSLREAAQAVIDRWESPQWTHDAIHTSELIFALREALREHAVVRLTNTHQQLDEALEYELWGRVFGSHGGRLSAMPIDPRGVWPEGTAVYVRRIKK